MVISYNLKAVLLFFSFSMGCFLTLSKSWIWFQQRRSKGKAAKRTAVVLCVGFAFVIMFAVMYKNWLYGSAVASWPIDDLGYLIGGGLFASGAIYVIVGIGLLIQDHVPIRKNINPLAFSVTGLGLIILAGILFHRICFQL